MVSAKAECPAGEKLVGGGGAVATQLLGDGYLHSFRPADGPDGDLSPDDAWLVDAHVDSDDEAAVGATAICGDEAARLERTKVTVPEDGSRSGVAHCANGENVSAGGVVIGGSISQAFLSSSFPVDGRDRNQKPDDGWEGRVANTDGPAKAVKVFALCVSEPRSYATTVFSPVPAGGEVSTLTYCEAGSQVTGAGVKMPGRIGNGRFSAARPNDDPFEEGEIPSERLVVSAQVLAGSAVAPTGFAVCAP